METLTPREREILALIGQRMRSRQIAHALRIREATVRKHRANLCGKLGLDSAARLVAYQPRAR